MFIDIPNLQVPQKETWNLQQHCNLHNENPLPKVCAQSPS